MWPHSALFTTEKIDEMGWVLSHPAYSPYMAPSDKHLFSFLNEQMQGQAYEMLKDIHKAVHQWIQAVQNHGEKYVHKNWVYIEKCVYYGDAPGLST